MPATQRHMVYLASNMDGLELERYEVERVLARQGMTNVGFACPREGLAYDWDFARQQIELADVFVLLVGDDYGQVSQTGISALHREYVHARTLDIPVYAFLKNPPSGNNLDADQTRLRGFYQLVTQQVGYKLWHLRDELTALVKATVNPDFGPGWVRAEPAAKAAPASVPTTPKKAATSSQLSPRERLELNRKTINLLVQAKVYQGGNLSREELALPAKLDQLYRALQSSFASDTSEDRIRGSLEAIISDTVRRKLLERNPDAHAVDDIRIPKEQFRSVLETWQQLGQVHQSSHSGRDYWRSSND